MITKKREAKVCMNKYYNLPLYSTTLVKYHFDSLPQSAAVNVAIFKYFRSCNCFFCSLKYFNLLLVILLLCQQFKS